MADFENFEMCAVYKREGERHTISCKKGLWSVNGFHLIRVISEAFHYFTQYKRDGEYADIIGGKSPIDIMMEKKR